MSPPTTRFRHLSDDQLLAEVLRLAAAERCATAAVIRSLIELDSRPHLYLREGCSSLFIYCTRVLHLAEGCTYNRIEVARAARRFPIILDALEQGGLTLTAARLLAPHLTEENHRDALASARHKSKSDVERLIVSLRPRADVPSVIRKLPEPRQQNMQAAASAQLAASEPTIDRPQAPVQIAAMSPPRPAVTPLTAERYKIELTISGETLDKLRRIQDLLRHPGRRADLAEVFDRALASLLGELERRRFAATTAPRAAGKPTPGTRYIPAGVRRAVWKRDASQCAFVGTKGRCTETSFLEFHHVEPYAAGGEPTVENIQLRCRAHNVYEARLFFGSDMPGLVRESMMPWLE